jgi:hypothetical protein
MTNSPECAEHEPEPQWSSGLRAARGNIVAGFRLALFLRTRTEMFSANVNQTGLALLALFLAAVLFSFLASLPRPEFNSSGVSFLVTTYVCMVAGLWLAALLHGRPDAVPLMTVMMACASIFTTGAYTAMVTLVYGRLDGMAWYIGAWAAYVGTVLWTGIIALRIFRLVFASSYRRSIGLAVVFAVAWYLPIIFLPYQELWEEGYIPDETAEAAVPEPIDVERTFYAQPGMVDRALAGIEPGRQGVTDLYFVGFAGHGGQDVFMKEVKVANSLFDGQFDTEGRSLALVNNRQTIENLPLANVSNLQLVLNGVAERMDRDEDVLFLFLTSHGSKDRLSTNFWPLRHNSLGAADLRSMLDEAGIGWRVVVISACYSGSFVDELRSDHTLVITASRADRNSFGCSNEADMTYFGRALIDEALRETRSFTAAYDLATERVTKREEAEGKTPSEPQIFVGSRIQAKLTELTERLEALENVAARD